jgi:hypothetical protein
VGAGGRERLRAAGLIGDSPASSRVRAGAVLVMWAWELFVLAGAVLAKSTEHWQCAMPPGAGHSTATATFTTPIAATVGLAAWAHGLTPRARNGHDTLYGGAFLVWAAQCSGTLLAWTAAAARTVRHLDPAAWTLRLQARLAAAATAAMGVIAAATAVWWAVVATASPPALTGGPDVGQPSALVPQLVLAMAIMVAATGLAAAGARRERCRPCPRGSPMTTVTGLSAVSAEGLTKRYGSRRGV